MKNQILYFECYSGISGDMTVASLLDLGANKDVLIRALNGLGLNEFSIETSRVMKNGISAFDFNVILKQQNDHCHRNLNDIFDILDHADLSQNVLNLSKKIFLIVAQSEAKAHGLPLDQVHFHEVGATDSIVDIVSTAVCLDNLKIEKAIFSTLSEGSGHIVCQHGILPVPVPAVVNIVSKYGLPIRVTQTDGELITPTGAAIAAAIQSHEELPDQYRVLKVGYGAGKRNYADHTNVLRAYLLEETSSIKDETDTVLLECNIDDMTGEELGYALKRAFACGAYDAWFTPIYMKKNRPAWTFSIICPKYQKNELVQMLFQDTSTIGIRFSPLARTVMHRDIQKFDSSFGPCNIKISTYGNIVKKTLEYDDVARIAEKKKMAFRTVYGILQSDLTKSGDKIDE